MLVHDVSLMAREVHDYVFWQKVERANRAESNLARDEVHLARDSSAEPLTESFGLLEGLTALHAHVCHGLTTHELQITLPLKFRTHTGLLVHLD
jgi:hypothetical protein